jgi:hypothetical protein
MTDNLLGIPKIKNKSILIALILIVVFLFLNSLSINEQELFLHHTMDSSIEIKSIKLNNQVIQFNQSPLKAGYSDFIKTEEMAKYPNKNLLEISFFISDKENKLECVFFTKKNDCYEEVVIGRENMWCDTFCSNAFD